MGFICYIAVLSCHRSDYIVCSGYFRLSVYMWGILLRIYVADSRRNSVFAYFGKRGVAGFFLVSEPDSTFDFRNIKDLVLTSDLRRVIFTL